MRTECCFPSACFFPRASFPCSLSASVLWAFTSRIVALFFRACAFVCQCPSALAFVYLFLLLSSLLFALRQLQAAATMSYLFFIFARVTFPQWQGRHFRCRVRYWEWWSRMRRFLAFHFVVFAAPFAVFFALHQYFYLFFQLCFETKGWNGVLFLFGNLVTDDICSP